MGDTTEAEKLKNEILEIGSLMVNYRFALAHLYIEKGKYEKALDHLLFNYKYDLGDNRVLRNIYILLNDKNCPYPLGYCNKILAVDPKNEPAILFMNTHR